MKRFLILGLFLLGCAFHSQAQAGGFLGLSIGGGRGVNLQVGGGRVFAPRAVVVQQKAFVQPQRVFVQRQFVAPQKVFVRRQFAPVYQQRFFAAPVYSHGVSVQSFAAPSFSYGVQSFGVHGFSNGGCGALLAY